ncbi:MAG: hypothetical protein ACO2Y1_09150, partial [Flavobacteriaceae bacterium]
WCFIENLILEDGNITVSRFINPLPVIDGWIQPRRLSPSMYNKWSQSNTNASGTPFKRVDKNCLMDFKDLKNMVIQRLKKEIVFEHRA